MIQKLVWFVVAITLLMVSSMTPAQVTVIINKDIYEYDQPVRLKKVLEPIATLGDWYWPVSSIYDLQVTQAEREKASILSEIRRLISVYQDDTQMHSVLENLYQQVGSWTVATRVLVPISYNLARMSPQGNPMLQNGKYLLRVSPRPDVVHLQGAVSAPGAYKNNANTPIYSLVNSLSRKKKSDKSTVSVITPMGSIEVRGVAYWNMDFAQVMPGSQIYVPISSPLFDNAIEKLNERVVKLAIHRILPQ